MNRQGKTFLLAITLLVSVLALQGAMMQPDFETNNYYILSLGSIQADLNNLVELAKGMDLSVVAYEPEGASVTPGASAPGDLMLLQSSDDVLIVDANRFHLRVAGDQFVFTVRPSGDGYELVINPLVDIAISDALAAVLADLQELGLLGNEVNLEYQTFSKSDLKGPAPPDGVAIDSSLYGIVVSENWFVQAAIKGITQVGLRVEVVAEKLPNQAIADTFASYVLEESEGLAKLLLPIDLLLPLASSIEVGYVRPPYQPSVP